MYIPLILAIFNIVALLSGCTSRPTSAELDAWHQDAIAQNAAMIAKLQSDKSKNDWQFVIQGQTSTGQPVALSLSKLEALATTTVQTKEPHNTSAPNAIFNFRGVSVSTLLNEVGVAPMVSEITFVARDGFRATVSLADLRQYPIIIALERNGKKISRSEGGPLYLVFPQTQFPQLQQQ